MTAWLELLVAFGAGAASMFVLLIILGRVLRRTATAPQDSVTAVRETVSAVINSKGGK